MRRFNKRAIFGGGRVGKGDQDDKGEGKHVENGRMGGFGVRSEGQKEPEIWNWQ